MSELITRTARLVPYAKRPKQVPGFVTAYAHEPGAADPGSGLGNLYVVIEVLIGGRSSEEVADLVIESLGDHYYNQQDPGTDPLTRFEAAIKATNHQLAEYVSQGNASWIGKMSALAAVQIGAELHVAQTGSAEAVLYRGKASTRIAGDTNSRPTAPSKTFGSIASGELESGDRLLLATPALIHQVALTRLKTIIMGSTSNSAIAEITELLREDQNDRIAALIIEITTPEQAALQVRSEDPSEIHLGSPDSALAAAKMAAAPIAQATATTTKRVGGAAKSGWDRGRPAIQRAGWSAAGYLRDTFSNKRRRRNVLIGLGVVVIIGAGLWWYNANNANIKQLDARYDRDYIAYQAAGYPGTSKDAARTQLTQLAAELDSLSHTKGHAALDKSLGNRDLASGKPASIAGLIALTSQRLDQVNGLVKVSPTTVASLSEFKNTKPQHFELSGNKAYIVDSNNNSAIYVVNIATNSVRKTAANTTKLGQVVATTLSADGTGMYLLTSKPSVWFYRFDTDSLAEQQINLGDWEPAKAIAAYAGNLYLLGDDGTIYKHVPTYSGFSPKSTYLAGGQSASTLAVDGSVYVLANAKLKEYLAGVQKQAASAPANLSHITNLRSTNDGNIIVGTDATSQRVVVWDNHTTLAFSKQISLTGAKTITDATYDSKADLFYGLVDGRLASFK